MIYCCPHLYGSASGYRSSCWRPEVEEVYRYCVGDKQANLTTIQRLAIIKNHLLELQESMERIPRDTLDQVDP